MAVCTCTREKKSRKGLSEFLGKKYPLDKNVKKWNSHRRAETSTEFSSMDSKEDIRPRSENCSRDYSSLKTFPRISPEQLNATAPDPHDLKISNLKFAYTLLYLDLMPRHHLCFKTDVQVQIFGALCIMCSWVKFGYQRSPTVALSPTQAPQVLSNKRALQR